MKTDNDNKTIKLLAKFACMLQFTKTFTSIITCDFYGAGKLISAFYHCGNFRWVSQLCLSKHFEPSNSLLCGWGKPSCALDSICSISDLHQVPVKALSPSPVSANEHIFRHGQTHAGREKHPRVDNHQPREMN